MMFVVALSAVLLAANAAGLSSGSPPEPGKKLDIREMTQVNGILQVIRRSHHVRTNHTCLSAKKITKISETQYKYQLRSRNGRTPSYPYVTDEVIVNLFESTSNSKVYEARYTSRVTGLTVKLTLKKKHLDKCFVLWVENSDEDNGCELLMNASAFDGIIPIECARYYERHCSHRSVELHRSDCIYN
uniref:Putative secreted protein n=1 Tax=Amblyomma triste TaxID=251400 RepID=A0A023GAE9_AMBTT